MGSEYSKLLEAVERTRSLLYDKQVGLFTWHSALSTALEDLEKAMVATDEKPLLPILAGALEDITGIVTARGLIFTKVNHASTICGEHTLSLTIMFHDPRLPHGRASS